MYDFECQDCHETHEVITTREVAESPIQCPDCGGPALRQASAIGGYQGNTGGASTRPRNAGAFKREKRGKT